MDLKGKVEDSSGQGQDGHWGKVDRVPGEMDAPTATVQPERGAHRGLGTETAHPLGE